MIIKWNNENKDGWKVTKEFREMQKLPYRRWKPKILILLMCLHVNRDFSWFKFNCRYLKECRTTRGSENIWTAMRTFLLEANKEFIALAFQEQKKPISPRFVINVSNWVLKNRRNYHKRNSSMDLECNHYFSHVFVEWAII